MITSNRILPVDQESSIFLKTAEKGTKNMKEESERMTTIKGIFCNFTAALTSNPSEEKKFRTPRERRIMNDELRKMPSLSGFRSNHLMVNRERVMNYLPQLRRCSHLDNIARVHAIEMAEEGKILKHLSSKTLLRLQENGYPKALVVMNAGRSSSILDAQNKFMNSKISRSNILDPKLKRIGFGCENDEKGRVYSCQMFTSLQDRLILI